MSDLGSGPDDQRPLDEALEGETAARVAGERDPSSLDSIRKRAVGGVLSLGIRNVIIRALGLLGTIVLARLLAPEDFGVLALGLTLQLVGNVLASGGLGAELIRRAEPPRREELRAVLAFQLIVGLVLVALVSGAALIFGGAAGPIALIAASIPVAVLCSPARILLQRELDWNLLAVAEVAGVLVFNALAIGLVVAGLEVWGVALAAVVQAAVTSALLIVRGPIGLVAPLPSLTIMKPLLRFGIAYQSVALIDRGRDQAINSLAAALGGFALLGVWSAAYRIFLAIQLVFEALYRVSFPAMARMIEAGQDAERMLATVLRLNATAFGAPAAAVGGSAPVLVPVVFGADFDAAIAVLPFGAAALFLSGPALTAGMSLIQAKGDAGAMIRCYLAQALTWIGGSAILIGPLGAEGIGVAMLASSVALVLAVSQATRRHAPMRYAAAVWPAAAAALAGGGAAWLVTLEIGPLLPALLASLAASQLVFLAAMALLRRNDLIEFRNTLGSAISSMLASRRAA